MIYRSKIETVQCLGFHSASHRFFSTEEGLLLAWQWNWYLEQWQPWCVQEASAVSLQN